MTSNQRALAQPTGSIRQRVAGLAVAVFALPERGAEKLLVWEDRIARRQALSKMDPHLLDDMGITPEDAARESAKPFWRD